MAGNSFKIPKSAHLRPNAEPTAIQDGDAYFDESIGKFRFREVSEWTRLNAPDKFKIITADHEALDGENLLCDSDAGPFEVQLPANGTVKLYDPQLSDPAGWFDNNVTLLTTNYQGGYSPDGINWTLARTGPDVPQLLSVAWGSSAGLFVAIGNIGPKHIVYSPDGINWTSATTPDGNWGTITYSDDLGRFVAVAAGAGTYHAMYSDDGINWTGVSVPETNIWRDVIWCSDLSRFVAVGQTGTNRVMYSSDGITWINTSVSTPGTPNLQSVAYSDTLNRFVAVGPNNYIYSTDGISWSDVGITGLTINDTFTDVVWTGVNFVTVSSSGATTNRVSYSADGINWTAVVGYPNVASWHYYQSLSYSPDLGRLSLLGRRVGGAPGGFNDMQALVSDDDGVTWTQHDAPTCDWYGSVWSPDLNIFVGVAVNGPYINGEHSMILDTSGGFAEMVYNGKEWRVF